MNDSETRDLTADDFVGRLMRVTHISDDLWVYGKGVHGEDINFSLRQDNGYEVGQVLFIGPRGHIRVADDEAWPYQGKLAEVVKVTEEYVVLDTGAATPRLHTEVPDFPLEVGNTVEVDDVEGILEVIDEKSLLRKIRIEDSEVDPEIFRMPKDKEDESLTFGDFGGYPHVISKARELIETPLLHASELQQIKAKPVKGVLFTGPPGTGKTHLARIISQVSDAEFYMVRGPQLVTKWHGDSEGILRRLFERAAEHERAIIFFDEIDSIAARRGPESHEASNRLVTQFLTEMDGYNSADNVIVVAATNRASELDKALLRPGRFDWQIEFELPTLEDRISILRLQEHRYTTKGSVNVELLGALSDGWSGAKLELLWKDAALLAAREGRTWIGQEDLLIASARVADRPEATEWSAVQ